MEKKKYDIKRGILGIDAERLQNMKANQIEIGIT